MDNDTNNAQAEPAKEKKLTYEDGIRRLQEIVKALESGGLTLDESVKLFEAGAALSRFCTEELEKAERKITLLEEAETQHG
ncbi:MAG: exodeoxyribonuclease VII small subunit [Clostridia bacterium]|nr:exodeoxyribonuclease VII small subunit [Clostridia bacterium]